MSYAPVLATPSVMPAPARERRTGELATLGFTVAALLAALRFGALLSNPPVLSMIGVVAVAAAVAASLQASGSMANRLGTATLLRVVIVAGGACVSLRLAGVPARELLPWHWGLLARQTGAGIQALNGLWPYTGGSAHARTALTACAGILVLAAAALAFWPGDRHRGGRRLAALAVLLGLYVTGAVNETRTGWQVQGVVLLAALYLLAWAERTWRRDDGRAGAWMLALAGVSVIAAGAMAGGSPLISFRSWNPFGPNFASTAFSWNQTYGPLSWPSSSETMVLAQSPTPRLWRATELDRFDGVRFLHSSAPPSEALGASGERRSGRWITRASFTVRGLSSRLLLSPGEILAVNLQGNATPNLEAEVGDGTQVLSQAPQSGTRYTVTAYAPHPTAAEMSSASPALPAAFLPYIQFDLPPPAGPEPAVAPSITSAAPSSSEDSARIAASPYAGVYALARHLAEGARTHYEVAARIQAFLSSGFTYDTDPPPARYPLVSFLLLNREGYCQQFSGAMALMLRMDGIPARVAAGFLPGSRIAEGEYAVSERDAHAWVEVFFAGIGWVPFDPTPPQPSSLSGAAANTQLTPAERAAALQHGRARQTGRAGAAGAHARASGGSGPAGGLLLAGGAVAAAAALMLAATWRARRRTRGLRAVGDGAQAVAELADALARLGIAVAPGSTLTDIEVQLERSHGRAAAAYVRALRDLRYGGARATGPSARQRRALRAALTAGRGPVRRLRGLLAIPPRGPAPGSRAGEQAG